MKTYTVKKGDNLWNIAQKYGVTVDAIISANNIKNKDLIYVGQLLTIPVKETTQDKAPNNQLHNAFMDCMEAIEKLPEFKTLFNLLEE